MDRDCYGREIVNRVRVGPATGLAVAIEKIKFSGSGPTPVEFSKAFADFAMAPSKTTIHVFRKVGDNYQVIGRFLDCAVTPTPRDVVEVRAERVEVWPVIILSSPTRRLRWRKVSGSGQDWRSSNGWIVQPDYNEPKSWGTYPPGGGPATGWYHTLYGAMQAVARGVPRRDRVAPRGFGIPVTIFVDEDR
jgi:hypothetical protein